jgi:CheY-like chemotaxis protein
MTDHPGRGPDPQPTATVLIVEDDAAVRELFCAMVQALGYESAVAADGAAALAAVAARPPDLVLSDVGMPGVGGVALCRYLKGRCATAGIPVVLITGMGDELREAAVEAGVDAFLSKPIGLADLGTCLRRLLGSTSRTASTVRPQAPRDGSGA